MICKSEREGRGFGRESLTSIKILRESVNKTPLKDPHMLWSSNITVTSTNEFFLVAEFYVMFFNDIKEFTKHLDVRTAMDRGKIISLL